MEGKEQTSKECQQIRYAYMEVCMENFLNFNPLKILNKWEEFSRSRLCIWMRKKVMNCFRNLDPTLLYTSEEEFDFGEFSKSQDKNCKLLSWISGNEVGKFEIALNLSYFGVLHNKEDSKEMHGFLKIFEKVISEEMKMRETRTEKLGIESDSYDDLKSHEFNKNFVAHMGDVIKQKLEKKYDDVDGWMIDKFSQKLIERDLTHLATMKKSATGDLEREKHISGSKENERITCLEACIKMLEGKYSYKPMTFIGSLCAEIKETHGGLVTNLFKKLQIGGVREIFVLEFKCRIVVHFLETISRTICEELDNEMLTKGDKKLARSDRHFAEVMSFVQPSKKVSTVINSDDATTWAQRFVMPVFGCLLSRILPKEFIEPVMAILNLVTSKKLELPHQLLDLYDKHPDIDGFDEGMNELKKQYLGLSEHNDLLNPGSRMLKNQSNMMQGILHYTSSLLHSAYLYSWENFTVEYLSRSMIKEYSLSAKEFNIVSTTKVSSDDSSCILSIIYEKEPARATEKQISNASVKNTQFIMSIYTEAKAKLYPLFCSKQSKEKSSTSGHSNIEEFNSLWYYKNTLLTPVIKFVSAAVKTHPNARLDDRYNTYANLRNNLFEHGGNIMLNNIVQLSQLSAHYKTMGMRTNKMWSEYIQLLLEKPHPSIGFFLIEHPMCCGMFGYDMSVYMACHNKLFNSMHLSLYKTNGMEFTEDGRPSSRTYLSFGQSKKYYAFKKSFEC
jgi:hypothetical protein